MNIIITGVAGFIGMHVAKRLLERGDTVYGIDNINPYYDTNLKRLRLQELIPYRNFVFSQGDVADKTQIENLFAKSQPEKVLHLAAQAGVRYSLENPDAYIQSNLVGFGNILEACRRYGVKHLTYASSSSVYGGNIKQPFSVSDNVDRPVSLYAATKKANELMAHSYSHLFSLPTTGLRYFTVYGPWGRPDMSPWLFSEAIRLGKKIRVFNHGNMKRDFTYIDDIVDGTILALDRTEFCSPDFKAYKIYNIGSHEPIPLMDFIQCLEKHLDQVAIKEYLPMQMGDVISTFADIEDFQREMHFTPKITLDEGIRRWAQWFAEYNTSLSVTGAPN